MMAEFPAVAHTAKTGRANGVQVAIAKRKVARTETTVRRPLDARRAAIAASYDGGIVRSGVADIDHRPAMAVEPAPDRPILGPVLPCTFRTGDDQLHRHIRRPPIILEVTLIAGGALQWETSDAREGNHRMAKEKFERTKPHVNVGTVARTLEDSSGQLSLDGAGSDTLGNPPPSTLLVFGAPGSSTSEVATVAYPFDSDFVFRASTGQPALTIDFGVDVLPQVLEGTSQIHVTLALLQDEPFVATAAGQPVESGAAWMRVSDRGLGPGDFTAVDGSPNHPDFSRAFQFGYALTGQYSQGGLDVEIGVDNMRVEITTVPEPTSIVLALSLGISLLVGRWWRGMNDGPRAPTS